MEPYFSAFGAKGFYAYSFSHITVIILLFFSGLLIYHYRTRLSKSSSRKTIRIIMAIILLSSETLLQIWYISTGTWSAAQSLPLHLCSIAILLCPIMLITKKYSVYEIMYFWSMAGTTQAILTPDLWYGFPHFIFFQYFITHATIVLATLWMTFIESFRPSLRSLGKAFLATNIYAGFILIVNFLLGSNYLYLMNKPEKPSILDFLSPWPWYLLQLEFVVLFSCFLCYIPFLISKKEDNR